MRSFFLIGFLALSFAAAETMRYNIPSEAKQNQPSQSPAKPIFVAVPPSESKITWVHDNGRSDLRQLPETCGGGGLFFDYDNDGWMDIYLVNSGPSDFFTPKTPLKNALYHNNH